MKMCFVCNEYPPLPHGGIGIFVQTLAEALVKLGVEVTVIGYGRKIRQPFHQNGVKVIWLSLPNMLYRKIHLGGFPYSIASLIKRANLSRAVNRLVRAQDIDLVESHDFNGSLAQKPPCKLVVRLHGSVTVYRHQEGRPHQIEPLDRYYEKLQLSRADYLIAVSQHIGLATRQILPSKLRCEVIYNGVDTTCFSPRPDAVPSKQVLFVGNMMWRKGVFDLVHAAPYVVDRHPDVRFSIVGGVGGAHQRQLDAELAQLPVVVRERFDFRGRVPHPELPALYNQAAVFVFPSRVEAFGLTCVEAMACGRPVVATSLASGPELVEDGVSGLLANPANPAELASKINRLLDEPVLAAALGTNARQRVLEKFDLCDLGPRNLAYYQSLL